MEVCINWLIPKDRLNVCGGMCVIFQCIADVHSLVICRLSYLTMSCYRRASRDTVSEIPLPVNALTLLCMNS